MSRRAFRAVLGAAMLLLTAVAAHGSDHLDSPGVIADPRTDIGDLYAWTSVDGRQLNLAMTIVGHSFSDQVAYVFHVDSGRRFGQTTATTDIVCRFRSMHEADCRAGAGDRATGDAGNEAGLASRDGRFRVFAGLRDDPFFNNVKGSRDAFNFAAAELAAGVKRDAASCPQFSRAQADGILDRWKHTNHGPAQNFLAGWTSTALVVAVDLDVVNKGGPLMAVWAETASAQRRIDRVGRPLTGNALLGPLAPDDASDALKERYNAATPATAGPLVEEIEKSLALYDGYDGTCGNQLLATPQVQAHRYRQLAEMLADDRLWVNSASSVCTAFFAVELGEMSDCGGRALDYDASNIYRSLLATGARTGIDDGVHQDDRKHSNAAFPFLAPPAAQTK